jgi:hypothetical protein
MLFRLRSAIISCFAGNSSPLHSQHPMRSQHQLGFAAPRFVQANVWSLFVQATSSISRLRHQMYGYVDFWRTFDSRRAAGRVWMTCSAGDALWRLPRTATSTRSSPRRNSHSKGLPLAGSMATHDRHSPNLVATGVGRVAPVPPRDWQSGHRRRRAACHDSRRVVRGADRRVLYPVEQRQYLREQHTPNIRHFDVAVRAMQQLGAETVLQSLDGATHRRLGLAQTRSRAPKARLARPGMKRSFRWSTSRDSLSTANVRLRIGDKLFNDHFVLHQVEGKWLITVKASFVAGSFD